MTALPGESIFFPWTNRVDVEVFQRIFPAKVKFLRPLIPPFISRVLFDCPKGAGRLKARLALSKRLKKNIDEKERKRITQNDPLVFE